MNTEEREELLGLLAPAPAPALSTVGVTRMQAHLLREIAPEGSAGQARPAAKRPRRRFLVLAVPAGVAAAVCATVVSLGSGETERPSTDPEAVELLNHIAAAAAAQDALEVREASTCTP